MKFCLFKVKTKCNKVTSSANTLSNKETALVNFYFDKFYTDAQVLI